MQRLRHNILANYAGNTLGALLAIVLVPLYIRFMGIEAYGLVGVFSTLGATFVLLDMGLSQTLNRELARLSAVPDTAKEMRDLARTLEVVYWVVALLIGIIVFALAPLIAEDWVQAESLPTSTVRQAVTLMGLIMTVQWPISLYSGGLRGMQQQVTLNMINVGTAAVRGIGAILILRFISPTIQAFFIWQAFTSTVQTLALAVALWRGLPSALSSARFDLDLLKSIWRFAAGMSGISVLSLILTQLDKVILSKVLPLEMFGYYTLASTVASNLLIVAYPVNYAVFPRFSQLVSQGDEESLKKLYHLSCQLSSVLVLPAAIVLSLFAPEILLLWTGDPATAANTAPLVGLLTIGTALNGLMGLPYLLQLAYGWTKLTLYTNGIAILFMVPLMLGLTSRYGAWGGAAVWVILNSGYVLIELPLMHRRLLRGEQWRWYFEDVGLPMVGSLCVVALGKWILQTDMLPLGTFLVLALIALLSLGAAAMLAPKLRLQIFEQLALRRIL
ncbi:MAG: oligosaccharide flippase family protein [Anaerolineae bacterium]|nr:oligosaccharide flippase family protein [Anaerolineae bacterium]